MGGNQKCWDSPDKLFLVYSDVIVSEYIDVCLFFLSKEAVRRSESTVIYIGGLVTNMKIENLTLLLHVETNMLALSMLHQ